jgi:hypothetical protein
MQRHQESRTRPNLFVEIVGTGHSGDGYAPETEENIRMINHLDMATPSLRTERIGTENRERARNICENCGKGVGRNVPQGFARLRQIG